MLNVVAIFIGGGTGAVLRYMAGIFAMRTLSLNFPISTILVNIVGSFILGVLYAIFIDKPEINPALKLALTVGFCGGLTTFSTFSLEIFEMIKNAQIFQAILYIAMSIIICILAVWIGVNFAKLI